MAQGDYDQYARRIGRWDGVGVRERIASGRDGHIIDFDIDWPGTVYALPDEIRYSATEASAIIFDTPDRVSAWQLRLPQIPAEGNPREQTEATLQRRLEPPGDRPIQVRLADGEQAWTPHVAPQGGSVFTRSPEATLDDIRHIWESYREAAKPDGII